MKKILGLRNIVTTSEQWYYLLLYDFDQPVNEREIASFSHNRKLSYILYKTKHGSHYVGLTPISAMQWGLHFDAMSQIYPNYYSGQTIRLSRKEDEQQILISLNRDYQVISNLYNIFASRFGFDKMKVEFPMKYRLVMEKYWSRKE